MKKAALAGRLFLGEMEHAQLGPIGRPGQR